MASRRKTDEDDLQSRRPPAKTPEGREAELINEAINLAEYQLRNKTASAQVISYYLKLGSSREKLEQERLANENQLLKARVEQLESMKNVERLYAEAIEAMQRYRGHDRDENL